MIKNEIFSTLKTKTLAQLAKQSGVMLRPVRTERDVQHNQQVLSNFEDDYRRLHCDEYFHERLNEEAIRELIGIGVQKITIESHYVFSNKLILQKIEIKQHQELDGSTKLSAIPQFA